MSSATTTTVLPPISATSSSSEGNSESTSQQHPEGMPTREADLPGGGEISSVGEGISLGPGSPQSSDTSEIHTSGSKHHSNVGEIIGAALGSLAFIILALWLILHCRRHRKQTSWRAKKPEKFCRENMVRRRKDDQLDEKGVAGHLSVPRSALHAITFYGGDTPTILNAPGSRRDSEARSERAESPISTISTIDSQTDATSTVEPTFTEITHEYITPRTDRQMEIERKVLELQSRIIGLSSSENVTSTCASMESEIVNLRECVVRLRVLQEGEWARELTDVVPVEMLN
ncbi:hypothetical protein AAF712_010279 [Marasmius tenuissimus]|uniref:Uncharacterized protein n=1 Tax=Marasmius tenuissimus TaxID=585030 RepID=A0ABR2ZNJ0_9AGAR